MFKYLKFSLFYALSFLAIAAVLIGQWWLVLAYIISTGFIIAGDALFGDDTTEPSYQYPKLFKLQLWFALPLLITLLLVSIWSVAKTDVFGIGAGLSQLFDYNFNQAKENTFWWQHLLGAFYVGLMISMIGTVVAHELVHRVNDKTSVIIGRWLLAASFDSNFSIEHVYGHHRYVATSKDPATAPRGRNVYQHILISTLQGNISAWNIEKTRLNRRNFTILSWHNTYLRGVMMSILMLLSAYLLAGGVAVLYVCLVALWAKALLEIVNYMEHYGLVRQVNQAVAPRHSWNTNKKISSWTMFNLTRHSHHHAQGHVPFHQLRPYQDSPMMLNGYLGTIALTLIPSLWFKLMKPRLEHWDKHYATEQERALLHHHN